MGAAALAGAAGATADDIATAALVVKQTATTIANQAIAQHITDAFQSIAIGQQVQTELLKTGKRATDMITQAT